MERPDKAALRRLVHACTLAAVWLLVLTALNRALDGGIRSSLFYAVPVALAAWHSLRGGFVFAALGALSAWAGGAIPQPHAVDPLWTEGLWAFMKLSSVALGVYFGARPPRPGRKS